MIRKTKRFVRPKKAFEKARIEDENKLLEQYGLKNKREIWKTVAKVSYFRRRAKSLAKSSSEEQEILFTKLREKGLTTNTISDVLALNVEDLLKRRLPTVMKQKGLANTVKQARQFVAHKKVLIDGKVVNTPGYIVSVSEESKIIVKDAPKPIKTKESKEASQ